MKNKKAKMYSTVNIKLKRIKQESNELILLQFGCKNLKRTGKNIFGSNEIHPYFEIWRLNNEKKFINKCYSNRDNYVRDTCNPMWSTIKITANDLYQKYETEYFEIRIYSYSNKNDPLIGKCIVNINELIGMKRNINLELTNVNESRGTLDVLQYTKQNIISFLSYIETGTEIGLMVAVDFSSSNGHPKQMSLVLCPLIHSMYNINIFRFIT